MYMYMYMVSFTDNLIQGTGSFPADISVLEIESDLDWNPAIKSTSQSPFSLYDDGGVVYYKCVLINKT